MASTGNPSGGPVRRVAILGRVVQLGRRRRAPDAAPEAAAAGHERRIEALEERVDQLEALLGGLQEAVYRESVREGGRIGALEKRTEPSEISRRPEPGRSRARRLSAALGRPPFLAVAVGSRFG